MQKVRKKLFAGSLTTAGTDRLAVSTIDNAGNACAQGIETNVDLMISSINLRDVVYNASSLCGKGRY
jgi:hypothetical protein